MGRRLSKGVPIHFFDLEIHVVLMYMAKYMQLVPSFLTTYTLFDSVFCPLCFSPSASCGAIKHVSDYS